jgi:hypothetical protein
MIGIGPFASASAVFKLHKAAETMVLMLVMVLAMMLMSPSLARVKAV